MAKTEDGRTVQSATEARAGVTGHNVRWVLFVGTFATAAIFAGLLTYFLM